ncbi:MAG: triose-phosphate isomerase [Candidatus Riflebacteria bacterium HGW-Riflebacteria-1]|jgi:triosephosphate isomerase|nr:MAG: triose-phosphate isomerase [Candidatus Riflebacteria bacterium HGW-Riflebacteria-1]
MSRRPLIAANWKMHKTCQEARTFMAELLPKIADLKEVDVLVCPPYTLISTVDQCREGSKVLLGAQNMYHENKGAFTGEVAPQMLKDLNCEFVIIGHSERRWVFGETDETINKKVHAAIANGLIPVLCVGEKLDEREKNLTDQVILNQMEKNLAGVSEDFISGMVIAYEPVWAIGTGKNATTKDAKDAIALIREFVHSKFGQEVAEKVRILYGGSVKPENVKTYMEQEGIDGALVGGASLEADSFAKLTRF